MSRCCAHVLVSQARPSSREGLACETTHVSHHFRRVSAAGMQLQVESWANRSYAERIGSYSGWPPLGYVRTASPMSRTIVVQGGLRLLADSAMAGAAVIFLGVTVAHVILRLCVAREIIGFLSVTDTYIHTNYFRDATQN